MPRRGPAPYAEAGPLILSEGIEDSGCLHQVGPVVPTQGIDLERHEQAFETQVTGPADLGVEARGEDLHDPRSPDEVAGHVELGVTRGAAPP